MAILHKGSRSLNVKASKYFLWCIILLLLPIAYWIYLFKFSDWSSFGNIYNYLPCIFFFMAYYYWRRAKIFRVGAKGEKQILKHLKKYLPNQYRIFTNCRLNEKKCADEIDILVVGENGIFAIEVKNHNGFIRGSEEEDEWKQEKIGKHGKTYCNKMKNPIRQTKRHAHNIAQYLRSQGIRRQWVEGILVFSNPDASVFVKTTKTKVFTSSEDVENYILNYEPSIEFSRDDFKRTIKCLRMLC